MGLDQDASALQKKKKKKVETVKKQTIEGEKRRKCLQIT